MQKEPRDGFTREELQELKTRAVQMADIEGLNFYWQRAYIRLADAADHLDAMMARCTHYSLNEGVRNK